MDRARAIYLANKREDEAKKAARKAAKKGVVAGAATRPVITRLMERDAAANKKRQDLRMSPTDDLD